MQEQGMFEYNYVRAICMMYAAFQNFYNLSFSQDPGWWAWYPLNFCKTTSNCLFCCYFFIFFLFPNLLKIIKFVCLQVDIFLIVHFIRLMLLMFLGCYQHRILKDLCHFLLSIFGWQCRHGLLCSCLAISWILFYIDLQQLFYESFSLYKCTMFGITHVNCKHYFIIILCGNSFIITVCATHRIIDDRMEKYGSLFVFISKQHCRAALKNLLADGRGG